MQAYLKYRDDNLNVGILWVLAEGFRKYTPVISVATAYSTDRLGSLQGRSIYMFGSYLYLFLKIIK